MSKTLGVVLACLLGPLAVATAAAETRSLHGSCTVETCPGLISFANPKKLVAQLRIEQGSAILAYQLGISLLDEDCCFANAVGYLAYALTTRPQLSAAFYDAMNSPMRNSAGRYARAILAVSSRVRKL